MGKRRRGLLKLGLKRAPRKVFIRQGFGGYYKYKPDVTLPNGQLVEVREQHGEISFVPLKPVTLEDLGLKRLENGRIVKAVKPNVRQV